METPTSILFSILWHNSIDAKFTALPKDNNDYGMPFKYKCEVNNHVVYGYGQSKKKAKHSSSKKMVLSLLNDQSIKMPIFDTPEYIISKLDRFDDYGTLLNDKQNNENDANGLMENNDSSTLNKISELQIICSRKHWNILYLEVDTVTNSYFMIDCSISQLNLSTTGKGKSKKAAKNDAATKMMDLLKKEYGDEIYLLKKSQSENQFQKSMLILEFFEKLIKNNEKMKILKKYLIAASKFMIKCQDEIEDDDMLEKLMLKIVETIDCKLIATYVPNESESNGYKHLTELVMDIDNNETITLIIVWAINSNKNLARIKSYLLLIKQIMFYISNSDPLFSNEMMK